MEQTNDTAAQKPKRRFARNPAGEKNTPAPKTPAKSRATRPKTAIIPDNAVAASPDSQPDAPPRITKAGMVIGLLSRPEGATITQMREATGWQQHSVRGFLAGTLKKKTDVALTSDKTDGVRTYRLVASQAAPA